MNTRVELFEQGSHRIGIFDVRSSEIRESPSLSQKVSIDKQTLEQRATDRATVTGRIDEEKVRLIHRFEIFVRENQSLYAVLISAWVDGLENLMSNTIVVRKVELSDDESRILRRNGKRVD